VGHGTFVAGVVRTPAPKADVHVHGFLTRGGAVYESELILQMNKALDDAPDVITMSAGTTTRNNHPPLGFAAFWENRLRHCKGTVFVAAAGNNGERRPFYPAAFPWALSVGAVGRNEKRAWFTNFGSWVDVYAEGVDIVNAFPNGEMSYKEPPLSEHHKREKFDTWLATWSGTSFSAPLVAGMIAARMSKTGQTGRQAADSIRRIAEAHARAGTGPIARPEWACEADPARAGG
jgi:subtilisin family serine protease